MTQPGSPRFGDAPRRRNGIFYVTDLGFALPTIASALEVRRKIPPERADVRILTTAMDAATSQRLRDFLHPRGIVVDDLPAALFSDFDHRLYNTTHVPISALGRFFMLDCVPDIYDRILYLDGDTWPLGNPGQLLDAVLPAGSIAAAEDQAFFYQSEVGDAGNRVRAYFRGLGLDGRHGYFNSGVLLADAATWRLVAAEAFDYFRRNTARCLYHDQSALNAVAGRRRVRLSPRWNFASGYDEWGIPATPPPHIVHFCGGGKPWARPKSRFHDVIAGAFAELTSLGLSVATPDASARDAMERAIARQRLKHRTVLLPRLMARRRAYRRLVETSAIG